MKRIASSPTSSLLRWARESIGLDTSTAAKRIGVSETTLRAWESGTASPSLAKLRTLADTYKRPLAIFFLAQPPKDFQAMRYFRRLPGPHGPLSTELLLEIRKALTRRSVALDISKELGESVPEFVERANPTDNPSQVADRLRMLIGISVADQFSWKDDYEALGAWKSAIERLHVLVFQTSGIETAEMRGASTAQKRYPIILVNPKDPPRARIFSLVHEFAHVLLHRGTVCDLEDSADVEVFCNRVAGEVLVPTAYLEKMISGRGSRSQWTEPDFKDLAIRFKVSSEVIARRLLAVGRITPSFYQSFRESLLKRPVPKPTRAVVPQFRKVLASAGLPFTRLVLEAYRHEAITASAVSDYLGVKLKEVDPIVRTEFRVRIFASRDSELS